ncbi:PD-(D/E)XK motif protein [Vibrio sp. V27_P1S3P104]|uniref:PD-(D/E)XK motif protein n=1 Tax=Vibrio TaxID=662 RepID=UPI0005CB061E|nr:MULTISPECIES: PD-(D/E)XK motif protein [Vibrio]NAW67809.1 PD-(D/E)XK motif protein [Vibrio sp. V28_P6S34P95]NAX33083.1 PD-(D/E)XK motif protein [Vibrio sp. V29_P1S30P107]NAX37183.1 PD-(D/E)XK motif protein [Vibrio sp. V27_P1S3P104]NAX41264.1 PD-(D/E)XK motif protein [Vibrio sp. V26_P1S5P106]
MSSIETPWTKMALPKKGVLTTLRVGLDSANAWYWIRCKDGQFGVAIQLPGDAVASTASIKGTSKLNITRVNDTNGEHYLGVVIGASELATVFYRLCLDLVSACQFSTSPDQILAIIKRRVLVWQRLFEKGRRKLSPEECLGLISELKFLRENWIPDVSTNGVMGWLGPTGAAQDFHDETIGVTVEIKSHAFDSSVVKISSREQLDAEGSLFLTAYPGGLSSDGNGVTLNDFVEETRNMIPLSQYAAFDELLLSARYIKDDCYDELYFELGEPRVYLVDNDFPRLIGDNLPPAIGRVRYDLDLTLAADWACTLREISERVKR